MDALFFVNGKHTGSHVYRVGENVIMDCQVIATPVPTVTWSYGQQTITTTARIKVCFMDALLYKPKCLLKKWFMFIWLCFLVLCEAQINMLILLIVFKVVLSKIPNFPLNLAGALQLQLRINGVRQADAGIYSCTATNRHGVTTKSIKLTVTK